MGVLVSSDAILGYIRAMEPHAAAAEVNPKVEPTNAAGQNDVKMHDVNADIPVVSSDSSCHVWELLDVMKIVISVLN